MAHDIQMINGKYQAFTAEKAAWWDTLGTYLVDKAQTWGQAAKLAGLDFELIEAPIYTNWTQSGVRVIADYKAIIRKDTRADIAVVGKTFGVMQPVNAFTWVDTLIESRGAHYVSAGLLGDGKQMWILARVPSADFAINGEDKHETYLLFCVGFDGSMARITKLTTTRVVCRNTLNMALAGAGVVSRIKNTKNADLRMAQAQALISGAVQDSKTIADKLQTLADRMLTKDTTVAILDKLFPKTTGKDEQGESVLVSSTRRENMLQEILLSYESNDQNAYPDQRGTAFNLLNAITDYTDHMRGTRGEDKAKGRAESAAFGSGDKLKTEALEVITLATNGAPARARALYSMPNTGTSSILDTIISQN